MVGAIVLLSPWGALAAAVALVPVVALALAARRGMRAAAALRLPAPSPWPTLAISAAAALGLALIGLAAAQPAIETIERRQVRTQSEVMFVVDVSRSMLASPDRGAQTRLDRARAVVRRLRASVEDVPAGVAGITDRVLPYLFPTVDLASFDSTVARSVLPEAPPPAEDNAIATTFADLAQLTAGGYFDRTAKYRSCVLVTDGEARTGSSDEGDGGLTPSPRGLRSLGEPASPGLGGGGSAADAGSGVGDVGSVLGGDGGCALVVVRVGGSGDRIFLPNGKVEGQYRPVDTAAGSVQDLADASGGRAFSDAEVADAAAAVRAAVGQGPAAPVGTGRAVRRLAPWLVLAGALLLAVLVAVRLLRGRYVHPKLFQYAPVARRTSRRA